MAPRNGLNAQHAHRMSVTTCRKVRTCAHMHMHTPTHAHAHAHTHIHVRTHAHTLSIFRLPFGVPCGDITCHVKPRQSQGIKLGEFILQSCYSNVARPCQGSNSSSEAKGSCPPLWGDIHEPLCYAVLISICRGETQRTYGVQASSPTPSPATHNAENKFLNDFEVLL